jgi:hypothetical protein
MFQGGVITAAHYGAVEPTGDVAERRARAQCADSEVCHHLRRACTNFGIDKDTSKFISIVSHLNPKFGSAGSVNSCEFRVRGTGSERGDTIRNEAI